MKIIEQPVGGDGGKVSLGIAPVDEKPCIVLSASFPVEKIIQPAFKAIDDLVDKLEQWIPGDQKEEAAKAKQQAHEYILKKIAEA